MPLTYAAAQAMVEASQEKAKALGIQISTAVVDAEGRLAAFGRMDGAPWISVEVSQAKAFTAAAMRRDGSELQAPQLQKFLPSLAQLYHGRIFFAESCTAIRESGVVIGGMGCSGGSDEQDGECARAGAATFSG